MGDFIYDFNLIECSCVGNYIVLDSVYFID